MVNPKKRHERRSVSKRDRNKWEVIIINAFALVLFGGAIVWILLSIYHQEQHDASMKDQYLASLPDLNDTIAHQKVCMVDDIYLGNESVSISIMNRIYFGCSTKATRDLASSDSLRYGKDPISKNKVDKAIALIALHPDKDGKVIYFESIQSFNRYLKHLEQIEKVKHQNIEVK